MDIKKYIQIICAFMMAIILTFSFSAEGSAEEIVVNEGDSLQKAIDDAKEGAILKINKGIYEGPIEVNKPLTITGEEGAIIDGGKKGNVVIVKADNVTISGVSVQNSGRGREDSGIFIDGANFSTIENNVFQNVHYGIYVKNSKNSTIAKNAITSFKGHFSSRGNGIHIFKGSDHLIKENRIFSVQDGIYFDFATKVEAVGNEVEDSRYALHYMFSDNIYTAENKVEGNITGFMIMDSAHLLFERNTVKDQFHYRGFGVLIYDSDDVEMQKNEIVQNSTGISLEKARNTHIHNNVIAANQIGLAFRLGNENNVFYENNFIANVVSSTVREEKITLDNGEKGNYWDDYKSFDIDGDGIGEEVYKAGSLYDRLLETEPYWQLFFESPAIQVWSKAESMFPSLGSVEVYDKNPLVEPVDLVLENGKKKGERSLFVLIFSLLLIGSSVFIIIKGRKFS